jgi:hypothetical protein
MKDGGVEGVGIAALAPTQVGFTIIDAEFEGIAES